MKKKILELKQKVLKGYLNLNSFFDYLCKGKTVIIDKTSLPFFTGSTLDYVEEMISSR